MTVAAPRAGQNPAYRPACGLFYARLVSRSFVARGDENMLKGQSRGRRKDGAASPPVSVLRAPKKPTTEPVEVGKHLVVDPRVCHGQLTFHGTRVPVHTVLVFMSKGWTIEQILADWPELNHE